MLIIHAPKMLQHCLSTGGDRAQQPHGAASVLPDTELATMNCINTTDEGLDLLRQLLGTKEEGTGKTEHTHNYP